MTSNFNLKGTTCGQQDPFESAHVFATCLNPTSASLPIARSFHAQRDIARPRAPRHTTRPTADDVDVSALARADRDRLDCRSRSSRVENRIRMEELVGPFHPQQTALSAVYGIPFHLKLPAIVIFCIAEESVCSIVFLRFRNASLASMFD